MNESPPVHPAEMSVEELLKSCRLEQTRSGGPGGQHRNKVSTAIVITHLPTGLSGQASERRSQNENRQQAISRLRTRLALAVRTDRGPLAHFQPPAFWQSRIQAGRIEVSTEHADFPKMLAIALDLLADHQYDVSRVAKPLGCSATQLVRFLGKESAALLLVNDARQAIGKRKYRVGA